jgi:hypothetical protein
LLVRLDSLPLREGFKSIEGFCWKPIWRIGAGSLDEFMRIFARRREATDMAIKTVPALEDPEMEKQFADTLKAAAAAKTLKHRFSWNWHANRLAEAQVIFEFGKYQRTVAMMAGQALDRLAAHWSLQKEERKRTALDAIIPFMPLASTSLQLHQRKDEDTEVEMRACERFVCMSYVSFLLVMLVRIRSLMVALAGMYVLTLVGVSQYPFEPQGALQLVLVGLLVFVVDVVSMVFAQIHRDTVLSNLTNTKPGELGIDFYIRMASFVALPLLSLFASQFPSINRFFYSWLQPAVEALNR